MSIRVHVYMYLLNSEAGCYTLRVGKTQALSVKYEMVMHILKEHKPSMLIVPPFSIL